MFKVGDKVICIKKGQWTGEITGMVGAGPKYNEELVISHINEQYALCFLEYPLKHNRGYANERFRKADPIKEESANKALASIGIERIKREHNHKKITAPQRVLSFNSDF